MSLDVPFGGSEKMSGWIGVDLDGTLAQYDCWNGGEIGQPVPKMLARVKAWLAMGWDVRIFTARVGRSGMASAEGLDDEDWAATQERLIQDWTELYLGVRLPVTATKDFAMIALWDDRAVAVETNTGDCKSWPSNWPEEN